VDEGQADSHPKQEGPEGQQMEKMTPEQVDSPPRQRVQESADGKDGWRRGRLTYYIEWIKKRSADAEDRQRMGRLTYYTRRAKKESEDGKGR